MTSPKDKQKKVEQTMEKMAVIVRCSDGKVRQVFLNEDEIAIVTGLIRQLHNGKINVLETILEGVIL